MKARLSNGTAVAMSDGWRGQVERVDGDTVVCIQAGQRPNDDLRGYRAVHVRAMTMRGGKAFVDWKSRAHGGRRERVVDLSRARLDRQWQGAPPDSAFAN